MPQDYSYEVAGFDNFLSRSVDNTVRKNLESPGPTTRELAYDRIQTSGQVKSQRIGNFIIDGDTITQVDDQGNVVRIL